MGAKLCCLIKPNSEVHEPKKIKQNDPCSRNLGSTTSPLQVHKTLKDILMASSNINPSVYLSPEFMINKDILFSPRISVSSERLVFGGNVGGELGYFEAMSRSPSEKLKKKVTFRLPEEADIIIFYSPNSTKSLEQ